MRYRFNNHIVQFIIYIKHRIFQELFELEDPWVRITHLVVICSFNTNTFISLTKISTFGKVLLAVGRRPMDDLISIPKLILGLYLWKSSLKFLHNFVVTRFPGLLNKLLRKPWIDILSVVHNFFHWNIKRHCRNCHNEQVGMYAQHKKGQKEHHNPQKEN